MFAVVISVAFIAFGLVANFTVAKFCITLITNKWCATMSDKDDLQSAVAWCAAGFSGVALLIGCPVVQGELWPVLRIFLWVTFLSQSLVIAGSFLTLLCLWIGRKIDGLLNSR